ncbi:MAG: hypothetical protein ABIO44_04150 [Saprospiraceae bacterium]
MMNQVNQDSVLRELIQSFKDYKNEFKASKKVMLWIALPVFAYFIYKHLTTPPQYSAKAIFMLNDSGGDNSGIASILGQFGIATPGQQVNLQKITEIAKTRNLAEKVFLSKATINTKEDFIGNHFIEILDHYGQWVNSNFISQKNELASFRFTQADISKFSTIENIALKKLHLLFLSRLETSFNDKSGIMQLTTTVADQDLSYHLCQKLFDVLSEFYIEKTVEKQRETYEGLRHKVDSIRGLLHGKDFALANFKDSYRNTYLVQDIVPQVQIDRDVRMLSLIYGEAVKNMEISSFALQNQTPFIQALDLPLMPLELRKQNILENLIKAIAYTFLLGFIFIILRKIIRDNS